MAFERKALKEMNPTHNWAVVISTYSDVTLTHSTHEKLADALAKAEIIENRGVAKTLVVASI